MKNTIHKYTIRELAEKLDEGSLSSVEICSFYIERVKKYDEQIKAFVYLNKDEILKAAEESDIRRKNGKKLSKYDGIPISIKDLISVKKQPCSCCSKILEGYIAPYDATVITRLKRAGFIPFGRNNMDEFAMGSTCENSAFFETSNPWDLSRVPGGSSGGSAAAVAAGESVCSLGSDTGGSVRQPAAFCGVVGLKPTYGTVSRYGLVAYASSLDQIGPITKDVTDAAILFDIISGKDLKDSTTLPINSSNCYESILNVKNDLNGVRIGLPKEFFEVEGLDTAVRKNIYNSVMLLKDLGAELVDISLPNIEYALASYYIIATAEASANLARFDGVRYGKRNKLVNDLNQLYLNSRGKGFGKEVKRRILLGTFVLSSGYYDAYYLKAQKVRTLIKNDFENAFLNCDLIISPTSPRLPFKKGELSDPLKMYLSDIYTISVNLAGICGISVPSEIEKTLNLPMDIQLMGPALSEEKLLSVARVFEKSRKTKLIGPKYFIE